MNSKKIISILFIIIIVSFLSLHIYFKYKFRIKSGTDKISAARKNKLEKYRNGFSKIIKNVTLPGFKTEEDKKLTEKLKKVTKKIPERILEVYKIEVTSIISDIDNINKMAEAEQNDTGPVLEKISLAKEIELLQHEKETAVKEKNRLKKILNRYRSEIRKGFDILANSEVNISKPVNLVGTVDTAAEEKIKNLEDKNKYLDSIIKELQNKEKILTNNIDTLLVQKNDLLKDRQNLSLDKSTLTLERDLLEKLYKEYAYLQKEKQPAGKKYIGFEKYYDTVFVPAGYFIFGNNEEGHNPKKIYLPDFYIDRFEVTNYQFKQFKSSFIYTPGSETYPVVNVSWEEAAEYAKWAGKRLPTAKEWEKAARGSDGRLYPWGNRFDPGKCNLLDSRNYSLKPVDSYKSGKSVYGAYNMTGNVWEWTRTDFDNEHKIIKGGSYLNSHEYAKTYDELAEKPNSKKSALGFRCVIDN